MEPTDLDFDSELDLLSEEIPDANESIRLATYLSGLSTEIPVEEFDAQESQEMLLDVFETRERQTSEFVGTGFDNESIGLRVEQTGIVTNRESVRYDIENHHAPIGDKSPESTNALTELRVFRQDWQRKNGRDKSKLNGKGVLKKLLLEFHKNFKESYPDCHKEPILLGLVKSNTYKELVQMHDSDTVEEFFDFPEYRQKNEDNAVERFALLRQEDALGKFLVSKASPVLDKRIVKRYRKELERQKLRMEGVQSKDLERAMEIFENSLRICETAVQGERDEFSAYFRHRMNHAFRKRMRTMIDEQWQLWMEVFKTKAQENDTFQDRKRKGNGNGGGTPPGTPPFGEHDDSTSPDNSSSVDRRSQKKLPRFGGGDGRGSEGFAGNSGKISNATYKGFCFGEDVGLISDSSSVDDYTDYNDASRAR